MGILNWANSKIKKMTWLQIAVLELCVAAFALLIAKRYPSVLGLQWQWYAAVGGVSYVYLIAFLLRR